MASEAVQYPPGWKRSRAAAQSPITAGVPTFTWS